MALMLLLVLNSVLEKGKTDKKLPKNNLKRK